MKRLACSLIVGLFIGGAVVSETRQVQHDQVYRAVRMGFLESGEVCEALIHHSRNKDEARKALVRHYGWAWSTATLTESEAVPGFVLSEKRTP